jgi:hypothetical protein
MILDNIVEYLLIISLVGGYASANFSKTSLSERRVELYDIDELEEHLDSTNIDITYKGIITSNLSTVFYNNTFFMRCNLEILNGSNQSNSTTITKTRKKQQLIWKYDFYDHIDLIYVEFDFTNTTHFIKKFGYEYYMFSYRIINENNKFMKRQLITDKNKTLTIHKAEKIPYVVCVTFFKKNITNSSEPCSSLAEQIQNDENAHDVNLCIDVLSHSQKSMLIKKHDSTYDEVMVGFILCLIAFLLVAITLVHFYIERPKKKRLANALRAFIQKNSHQFHISHSSHKLSNIKHYPTSPAIILTKPASSESFNCHSNNRPGAESDSENESLLSVNGIYNHLNHSTQSKEDHNNNNAPYHHREKKSFFFLGEPIKEEEDNNSPSSNYNSYSSPSRNETGENESETGTQINKTLIDHSNDEQSLESVSHILDSKPWASK